jgi:hypothetical protein
MRAGCLAGSKVIATTNGSGVASVTLTLPSGAQTVTVTAEGPYGLGHPFSKFHRNFAVNAPLGVRSFLV